MRTDRFTLAAITAAAVLAAFLTTTWIPTTYTPGPLLTWAVTYTSTLTSLAAATHLPVGRTLVASTLMVATALDLLLHGTIQGLTGARQMLAHARAYGINMLATTEKAA